MGLVPEPRSNNVVVVERAGRLQQADYDDSTTTKTQIFDLSSQVVSAGLGGLMTVVFHPDYNLGTSANKDYVYALYTTQATTANGFTENPNGSLFIRVSGLHETRAREQSPSAVSRCSFSSSSLPVHSMVLRTSLAG